MTYHINPKTGEPGRCRARYRCPYGNESGHSENQQELRKVYENFVENLSDNQKSVEFYFTTEEEMDSFTNGDCAHLAKVLAKKVNGELIVISDNLTIDQTSDNVESWVHMAVKLDDGRILDSNGLWTEKDLIKKWSFRKSVPKIHSIDLNSFKNFQKDGQDFTTSPIKTANRIIRILKDSGLKI